MRGPLVVKRALSQPLPLLAAFGSILLATTTLVALTMYVSSISDAGVRQVMETASYRQTTTTISAQVTAETFPRYDRSVRDELTKVYTTPPPRHHQPPLRLVRHAGPGRREAARAAQVRQSRRARPACPAGLGQMAADRRTGRRGGDLAEPDLSTLTPERLRPLADAIDQVGERLTGAGCANCLAVSRLPELLTQLATASLVTRSTMLIPVLQLLLLAAYALMLTARLFADHRRMEVALLRSRGAGTVRLAALAGGEALLVAVPCAIVAPFLGPPLLALVHRLPWIRASGVLLAPSADLRAFLVSFGVALAAAVLLALPTLAGARRTYVEEQSARGRGVRGLIEGAGADLALLAVAALAIWQLRRYGAPVTVTATGGLGIDPLIISGPALALLAGGMLGLRLVPRVSRLAERVTARRPTLAPALGAWQVSRRPLKYAGPALLLTLAIAIGVVSMAATSTWQASQLDQADHQAGSDLRLSGPVEGPELGSLGRGTAFTTLPGVTAASPAFRAQTQVSGESALLLGLDATKLGELFDLRPDLSAQTVAQMSRALAGDRAGKLDLPGRPRTLTVRVEADAAVPARMVVSDALGVWRDLSLGELREGGNRIELDLVSLAGRSGTITYPLSLRGLFTGEQTGLRLTGLSADGRDVPVSQTFSRTPGVDAFAPSRELGPLPVVLTPAWPPCSSWTSGRPGRPASPAGSCR
ncbi:FtsX-like permease family protein [Nonomuraea cavernae]|uniref:FtsX-like permease family protein n=1 Tax=Nonomuraea cavernae TaxID=2045107 RepID=UPI0033F4C4F4